MLPLRGRRHLPRSMNFFFNLIVHVSLLWLLYIPVENFFWGCLCLSHEALMRFAPKFWGLGIDLGVWDSGYVVDGWLVSV